LKKPSPEHLWQNQHAPVNLPHNGNPMVAFGPILPRIPPTLLQIRKTQFFFRSCFFESVITDAAIDSTINRLIYPAMLI
jgi:hypothetical protein